MSQTGAGRSAVSRRRSAVRRRKVDGQPIAGMFPIGGTMPPGARRPTGAQHRGARRCRRRQRSGARWAHRRASHEHSRRLLAVPADPQGALVKVIKLAGGHEERYFPVAHRPARGSRRRVRFFLLRETNTRTTRTAATRTPTAGMLRLTTGPAATPSRLIVSSSSLRGSAVLDGADTPDAGDAADAGDALDGPAAAASVAPAALVSGWRVRSRRVAAVSGWRVRSRRVALVALLSRLRVRSRLAPLHPGRFRRTVDRPGWPRTAR